MTNFEDRCSRCGKAHRSWVALARCTWPRAYEVSGDGPIAVLLHCRAEANRWRYGSDRRALVVTLCGTWAEAEEVAGRECGGACRGRPGERWGHEFAVLRCEPCAAADRRRVA